MPYGWAALSGVTTEARPIGGQAVPTVGSLRFGRINGRVVCGMPAALRSLCRRPRGSTGGVFGWLQGGATGLLRGFLRLRPCLAGGRASACATT